MTLEEGLACKAERGRGRKSIHPLTALFLAMAIPPKEGMRFIVDEMAILGSGWLYYPDVDDITWGEVILIFESAKRAGRINPAWCDVWISSIKSKVQKF